MHERYIYSDPGNKVHIANKGVTQGGVSSPLLWDLYISEILKGIPKNVKASLFADDIALYMSTDNPEEDKSTLERAIVTLNNNLIELGLELCSQKTVYVNFNRSSSNTADSEIVVLDSVIKASETARFLGLIFDHKLKFDAHIRFVKEKCERAMIIVKFLRGT